MTNNEHKYTKDEFWGITTFFNPGKYKNRYKNFLKFRESSKKQGLKLLAIELVFGDAPFELKEGDAEKLIQIRGYEKNILWQKERLLNIALEQLPVDCEYVAWLDCDIIFNNKNWITDAIKKLETYKVVQLFSLCVRMPKDVDMVTNVDTIPFHVHDNGKVHSFAYCLENPEKVKDLHMYVKRGTSGYAWVARVSTMRKIGFFDLMILGGGDSFMANTFANVVTGEAGINGSITHLSKYFDKWKQNAKQEVGGSVSYIHGVIFHIWHGEQKNRMYGQRNHILSRNHFNPEKDLRIDEHNLWSWIMSRKPELQNEVKKYFYERNEDGSVFRELISKIKSQLTKKAKKVINICLASDMNLIELLPTVVYSIVKNTNNPIHIYLLGRNLTQSVKDTILDLSIKKVKITIIDMEDKLSIEGLNLLAHTTDSTMDRLLLPTLLPKVDKIVYLDMDIVINGDILELYKMSTSDKGIVAKTSVNKKFNTLDATIDSWVVDSKGLKNELRGKIDLESNCFNAGILLLSLSKMRHNNFVEQILPLVEKYKMNDQVALNIYADGEYKRLPASWNVFVGQDNPKIKNIIHWIGSKKPWSNYRVPYFEYWKKYYVPFPVTSGFVPRFPQYKNRLKIKRGRIVRMCIAVYRPIYLKIDKYIGLVGIGIKAISPKMYSLLKNLIS